MRRASITKDLASITKDLVLLGEEHDGVLRTPVFPVNIRLLMNSREYHKTIKRAVVHMERLMRKKYSYYNMLQGISGAVVEGILFCARRNFLQWHSAA